MMSSIASFIIGCVLLALCLLIGCFFLNLLFVAASFALAAIALLCSKVWEFLSGKGG